MNMHAIGIKLASVLNSYDDMLIWHAYILMLETLEQG